MEIERSVSTYRLRMSLAGLKILVIFLVSIERQKPIRNLLRASLTTFSKHPWWWLHSPVFDRRASGIKCLILRRMDCLATFFIGFSSVSSWAVLFLQWTSLSLWFTALLLAWVDSWFESAFLPSSNDDCAIKGVLEHGYWSAAAHGWNERQVPRFGWLVTIESLFLRDFLRKTSFWRPSWSCLVNSAKFLLSLDMLV